MLGSTGGLEMGEIDPDFPAKKDHLKGKRKREKRKNESLFKSMGKFQGTEIGGPAPAATEMETKE